MRGSTRFMIVAAAVLLVQCAYGQTGNAQLDNLTDVLEKLRNDMTPLCSQLISVGRGLGGFAALWYIAARIWRHYAAAEPVDIYPLFRPFVLGLCIVGFPTVLAVIDGVLKPTVDGTSAMVKNTNKAVEMLLKRKEEAIKKTPIWEMYIGQTGEGDRDKWYRYTYKEDPEGEAWYDAIGNNVRFAMAKMGYSMQNSIKYVLAEILNMLFFAASLCINTLRTFQLVVLSILGPLVFGLAVFDGLQHTLTAWLARYINVFLWLPVANIFGSIIGQIQVNMLKVDIAQIGSTGDTFFSTTDTAYLVFMLIGIVGYFTVPTVAGFVVNAGDGGGMLQRVSRIVAAAPGAGWQGAKAAAGFVSGSLSNYAQMGKYFNEGLSGAESGRGVSGAIGRMAGKRYMANQLEGNSDKES